jgi:hypothetical protein
MYTSNSTTGFVKKPFGMVLVANHETFVMATPAALRMRRLQKLNFVAEIGHGNYNLCYSLQTVSLAFLSLSLSQTPDLSYFYQIMKSRIT